MRATLALLALLVTGCAGCKPSPCVATAHAAVALDTTCGAAGLARGDAELLVHCAAAYASIKRRLVTGACAAELVKPPELDPK